MKQVTVYTSTGRAGGKITLPAELFGQKPAEKLLAQVFYVYQARAHIGTHKTKTRAEVHGTTAKMYRQKGTGRARHGTRTAPIFVGGGIAHGPTGLRRKLKIPEKIAKKALTHALSSRFASGRVLVVDVGKLDGKTKAVWRIFEKLGLKNGKLLVLHGKEKEFVRAARNIPKVDILAANQVNAYEVISHKDIVITKAGMELLKETFGKEEKSKSKFKTKEKKA